MSTRLTLALYRADAEVGFATLPPATRGEAADLVWVGCPRTGLSATLAKFAQKGQRDEHREPRIRAAFACPADWCDLHVHVLLLSIERCRAPVGDGPDPRQRSPRYRIAIHPCYPPLEAPFRAPSLKENIHGKNLRRRD